MMKSWFNRTPINQSERNEHRKAILQYLLEASNGSTPARSYPDPALLQTPYLSHIWGSGMQPFEWAVLEHHIKLNPRIIAGFWPNVAVGDLDQICQSLPLDLDFKYIQPWVPRLDSLFITYNGRFVAVEISDSITPKLIGEACVKYAMFKYLHPTSLLFESIHIIHIVGNNLVSSLAVRSLPTFDGIPIMIFRYDISDIAKDPNDPIFNLYQMR